MKSFIHTTLPGLSLRRKGGAELDLFIDPHSSKTLRGFDRIFHQEKYGRMEFQCFTGEGFRIWRSEYNMFEGLDGESESDISFFELHIPLEGSAMHWWDGKKETRLMANQFAFDHVPYINDRTSFHPDHVCATLDIHCDLSFLSSFVEDYPVLRDFLSVINGNHPAYLLNNAVRFLSPGMKRLVQEILHFTGPLEFAQEYYTERVTLLLHAVFARASTIKQEYSNKKYLDVAVSARECIERHPGMKHSAKSLSEHTGVGVSSLHRIFREYHGTSLFDFGQQLRLEHAKRLLADTSLYVQEIAVECGYPEHANFTIAFRKRYGFSPQQYRDALSKTGAKNKSTNS